MKLMRTDESSTVEQGIPKTPLRRSTRNILRRSTRNILRRSTRNIRKSREGGSIN